MTTTAEAAAPGAVMEYVACVLCGADKPQPLVRLRRDRYLRALGVVPPTSVKVMCGQCGHIYQNPQLAAAEVRRLYRDVYRAPALGYADESPSDEYLYWKTIKARHDYRWLRAHLPPTVATGAALEIGCAEGSLLLLLARDGWRVTGVETTPSYAAHAREVFGLDVLAAPFEEADLEGRKFDLVIALKVLEHSKHPVEFLTRLHRILAADGWLCVTVPNALRPDRDLDNFLASPHISLFTPATLTEMLAVVGLSTFHIDDDQGFVAALARPTSRSRPAAPARDLPYRAIQRAILRQRVIGGMRREIDRSRRGITGVVKLCLRGVLGKETGDRLWVLRGRAGRPTPSDLERLP